MVEEISFFTRAGFLLLLFTNLVYSLDQISQLYDLTNLKASRTSQETFYLGDFFQGQNLSYSLTGTYSDGLNLAIPSINQRLKLISTVKKTTQALPSNGFDLIQRDLANPNLIYTIENQNFTFWDVTSFSSVKQLGTTLIIGGKLLGVYTFYSSSETSYLVIQQATNGYTASIYNASSSNTITPFVGMSLTVQTTGSLTSVSLYSDGLNLYAFLAVTSQIFVINFDIINAKVAIYNQIVSSSVQTTTFNPISIGFSTNIAYICDSKNGVFLFNYMTYLQTANSTIDIVELLRDPVDFGTVFSCASQNSILTVGTSSGVVLYNLPDLKFVKKMARYPRPNELYALSNVARLHNVQFFITSYHVSNVTSSFTIQFTTDTLKQDLMVSATAQSLFNTDAALSKSPPYIVLSNGNPVVIFSTPNYLFVYQLTPASLITQAAPVPYKFTGTLTVSNLNFFITTIVSIDGIEPNSMVIYNIKGNSQTDGFIAPPTISLYTKTKLIQESEVFWLPMSNYLSGNDVSYTITEVGINDKIEVTVVNPPKNSLISSIQTGNPISYSPVIVTDKDALAPMIILIPTQSSSSYIYSIGSSVNSLKATLACKNTTMASSTAATFVTNYGRIVIIECIFEDLNTEAYDVDWDIYVFNLDYTNSFLMSYKWLQILYSKKIESMCTTIFALRGNQIEVFTYYANSTIFTLTQDTPINANTVTGLTVLNPIDVIPSPSSCSFLLFYDFNAGLISVQVSPTTPTYVLNIIGLIGATQDEEIKMSASSGDLYIISPQSESDTSFVHATYFYDGSINSLQYLPVIDDCIYTDIDSTISHVAILCENIDGNKVLIFDTNDYTYTSVYTSIHLPFSGVMSFENTESSQVFIYTGDTLSTYSVNQEWVDVQPPLDSTLIPSGWIGSA